MSKKGRLALCFFGQPRLLEEGYPQLSAFIKGHQDKYDIDIFVHTWWDVSMVGKLYKCSPWRNLTPKELTIREDTIDIIRRMYEPKRLEYEAPRDFSLEHTELMKTSFYQSSPGHITNNLPNTLSNLYSKYKVSELLNTYCEEMNQTYDVVVSSRFDMLRNVPLQIEDCLVNKIYGLLMAGRFIIVDHFLVFTNQQLFTEYSCTFKNIRTIIESERCAMGGPRLGMSVSLNLEELITFNMLLYHDVDTLYNIVILTYDIPNLI
jgi:hypothetical protein